MYFKYLPIRNKEQYSKEPRELSDIKFIVVHATGNSDTTADAMHHYKYLNSATRKGSANYFVDENCIIQVIGDSRASWNCGDNQGYGRYLNGCNNYNSIGVEMCMNLGADQDKIYKNTVELVKNLMKKFNIDSDHVCRHFDVSRKICPVVLSRNNWQKWWQFKEDIKKPIEWYIDLSKNYCEFGVEKVRDFEELNKFEKEIVEAVYLKITDGSRMSEQATRQEVAVMCLRTLKKDKIEVSQTELKSYYENNRDKFDFSVKKN